MRLKRLVRFNFFKEKQKIQKNFEAKFVQILREIKEAKMKQIVLVIALFGAGMYFNIFFFYFSVQEHNVMIIARNWIKSEANRDKL